MCWSGNTGQQKAERILELLNENRAYIEDRYQNRVRQFFVGPQTLTQINYEVLNNGGRYLLKLDSLSPSDQEFVMYELFRNLRYQTEAAYKRKKSNVNAEIVLDEAPRWVAQGSTDRIANMLKDAVKITRAYGLSWTFIGQRIANLDKDIFSQMHTKWFGRGLGTGVDRTHMETELGKSGLDTYDTLNYQGGYFWLGVGDEVNLGVGTAHISIMSYGHNATDQLISMNRHIWR